METLNNFFGREYLIVPCTNLDVSNHLKLLPKEEKFKERLLYSISKNKAFKISDNCFLYYNTEQEGTADAVALHSNSAIEMFALLATVFSPLIDPKTLLIKIKPHKEEAKLYRSLITNKSYNEWITENRPVKVRIDLIRNKVNKRLKHTHG